MIKTAFIGNENFFDEKICEWLSEHTELALIIWTDKLTWSYNGDGDRRKRVMKRFWSRAKRHGLGQAADEFLYYFLYRLLIGKSDLAKVKAATQSLNFHPKKNISEIEQLRPDNINSEELQKAIASKGLDAMFAMCIDAYLPTAMINTPRLGTFLWHEGITPNYRGVYSPFWAMLNKDYENLGYTLLRMNSKLDAGDVYVQGKAEGIDPTRDWHSYIGHKAVLDSLPKVEAFIRLLENNTHLPIDRSDAPDGYYSYPRATSLCRIAMRRILFPNGNARLSAPANGNTTTNDFS